MTIDERIAFLVQSTESLHATAQELTAQLQAHTKQLEIDAENIRVCRILPHPTSNGWRIWRAVARRNGNTVRDRLLPRALQFCVCVLWLPAILYSSTISGTVKDPSGGLVPRAIIQVSNGELAQPIVITSDAAGHFVTPDLPPGSYSLRATAEGFEVLSRTIELADMPITLDLQLTVAAARQEVTVSGKALQFANTDPVYRQLRGIGFGTTISVENFTIQDDVATFLFRQGTVTFLAPVNGQITGAVFVGQGHFSLKPATVIDRQDLSRRIKAETVEDDFTDIVFRFSGGIHRSFLNGARGEATAPSAAAAIFRNWQQKVRQRHEIPLSFSDNLLNGDQMDNIDAELLAYLYNPARPPLFEAFIHGAHYKDLRFIFKGHGGALTALDSPEEVALVNYNPGGMDDGVWYLSHKLTEFQAGTASSLEDKRFVSARQYRIDTAIGNNDHLTSVPVSN